MNSYYYKYKINKIFAKYSFFYSNLNVEQLKNSYYYKYKINKIFAKQY